jgi:hypothetical protein
MRCIAWDCMTMLTSRRLGEVLQVPYHGVHGVLHNKSRYLRRVTQTVLRWYSECDGGSIQTESGPVFDERILNYRLDVELALKGFDNREVQAILYIHLDGCTHAQALRLAGLVSERPDKTVEDIEVRMGRSFERKRLSEFLNYIDHLR